MELTLSQGVWRLYLQLSARRRRQLLGLFVLSVFGAISELGAIGAVFPFLALMADPTLAVRYTFLGNVYGFLGLFSGGNVFFAATTLFVIMALGTGVVRVLLTWAAYRFAFGIGSDLSMEVFRRTLLQPYSYHVERNSSQTLANINKVQSVVGGVINPLLQSAVSGLFVIAIAIAILFANALVSIATALIFVVIYWIITLITRKRLNRNSQVIAQMEEQRLQAIQEGLGGIRDVILDGTHNLFINRYWDRESRERRAMAANYFVSYAPRYMIESFGMVMIAILAFILSSRGGISNALPVLGALALGAQRALPQVQAIYFGWASINATKAALGDVIEMLELPINEQSPVSGTDRLRILQAIKLDDVCFRYHSDGPDVVSNVSLIIERGARIGFVGKTGSGKSTLVDLLMGLLEPSRGKIMVDEQELTASNRRYWQAAIAHVPQAIYLSDATIAENIAFGMEYHLIDPKRVREAAERAEIAAFIETLPDKFETFVGERGVRLSGGQRQRIGLARAFYKNADLIILDEATSALDSETEAAVMDSIYKSTRDITVLIIAHRLTTLRTCDRIFELSSGKIVRECRYEDLGDLGSVIQARSK